MGMQIEGLTPFEQEEALNKIVAPWERGQNKVFTGSISKNNK